MENEFVIRPAEAYDLPLMWQMLYEAAASNPGIRDLSKEAALSLPQIRKYVEGWGRAGDAGFVASEKTGRQLGAAWYRCFLKDDPGYGFVSCEIPELTIGVIPDARGRGIGNALMEAIAAAARDHGYEALSLSVDRRSPAVKLYERHGFQDAGISAPGDPSVTMILRFQAANE